jgi:putative DNA primase/helicase
MTAEAIATALGGRKAGAGWTARCPAHDDRTPSLSIRDADNVKVLVRCHAGCAKERVIAALRRRGLSPEKCTRSPSWTGRRKPVEREPYRDDPRRTAAAAIWGGSKSMKAGEIEWTKVGARRLVIVPSLIRFLESE